MLVLSVYVMWLDFSAVQFSYLYNEDNHIYPSD